MRRLRLEKVVATGGGNRYDFLSCCPNLSLKTIGWASNSVKFEVTLPIADIWYLVSSFSFKQ
jgi:hypothetical protein